MDSFAHGQSGGVMRLLISFLDDPHAPMAVLHTMAKRGDAKFIRHLLAKVGPEPSATVKQNLKRIKSVHWLAELPGVMDELDEAEQQALVPLAVHSAIPRSATVEALGQVLSSGKPAGPACRGRSAR